MKFTIKDAFLAVFWMFLGAISVVLHITDANLMDVICKIISLKWFFSVFLGVIISYLSYFFAKGVAWVSVNVFE